MTVILLGCSLMSVSVRPIMLLPTSVALLVCTWAGCVAAGDGCLLSGGKWLGNSSGELILDCDGSSIRKLSSCYCGWRRLPPANLSAECGTSDTRPYDAESVQDRQFTYECSNKTLTPGTARMSDPLNTFTCLGNEGDSLQECACPKDMVIARIRSKFSDVYKDRTYVASCAKFQDETRYAISYENCRKYGWSDFKMTWSFTAPAQHVLVSMRSEHSNDYEDRKFQFEFCPYCVTAQWSGWSGWSECTPVKCAEVPHSGFMGSKQNRTRECRYGQEGLIMDTEVCKNCHGPAVVERPCECRPAKKAKRFDWPQTTGEDVDPTWSTHDWDGQTPSIEPRAGTGGKSSRDSFPPPVILMITCMAVAALPLTYFLILVLVRLPRMVSVLAVTLTHQDV